MTIELQDVPTKPDTPELRSGASLAAPLGWASGSVTLYLADCRDVLPQLSGIDAVISDPPYGMGYVSGHNSSRGDCDMVRKDGNFAPIIGDDEPFDPTPWLDYPVVVLWGANYYPGHLPSSMGWIFWDKGQRICNSDGELAFSSFDRALRVIEMNRVELLKEGTIHPTQKPVKLYTWLLENYAKPGMKLLDTHLGSGSHAIAAHYFGAHLTACEIDADYYAAAMARIKRETAQTTLFT